MVEFRDVGVDVVHGRHDANADESLWVVGAVLPEPVVVSVENRLVGFIVFDRAPNAGASGLGWEQHFSVDPVLRLLVEAL